MNNENNGSSGGKTLGFPPVNRLQARRQLSLLGYKPEEQIYLRFFYPADDPCQNSDSGRQANRLNWKEIETYQRQGRGVYFVVNGGEHKDENKPYFLVTKQQLPSPPTRANSIVTSLVSEPLL